MGHIFISYSRNDHECAYKIQRQLEAQGFKIWIDKNDIKAGAPFPMEILKAIAEATVVLVVWSKNASASQFVNKEIEEALNHKMTRSLTVIPIWIDGTPLHPQLTNLNAALVSGCTDQEIDELIEKIPQEIRRALGRQTLDFDRNLPINQQSNRAAVPGTGLISVPFLQSWYCTASVVGLGETVVGNHLAGREAKPYLCVVPQFLGDTTDSTIEQVYSSIQGQLDGQDFVAVHIKPNTPGKIMVNVAERGQSLDAVKTTHDAVSALVRGNRNLATLKIFTPMMAAMSGSIGHIFDSFWHVQEYHFDRQINQYSLLFDSHDL